MAKLNPDTHVLLDGAAKVYLRSNTKRWQSTFQIEGQWIRISTGKRDLEEAKEVAREHSCRSRKPPTLRRSFHTEDIEQ